MDEQLFEAFERFLKLRGLRTYARTLLYARKFCRWLDESDGDLIAANAKTIEEYRAYLLAGKTGNSRGTINNRLCRVRTFFHFLVKKTVIAKSPFDATYAGLSRGRIIPKNVLSVDDMGKLLDNFTEKAAHDVMAKSMIELLYGSAMRVSELATLKLSDIDFERGAVWVTDVKDGGVRRKTPATETSLKTVRRYMATVRTALMSAADLASGFLYPQRSEIANRTMLNRKLSEECRRLGLKNVSTHCFRHSAATHMMRAGASLREVQALLGHKRIANTEVYTHVVKEDLKAVMVACHPRERTGA